MPGPNSSRVRSGKDLKPLSVIDFRYMSPRRGRLAFQPLQRFSCRFLLGFLLAPATSRAERCAVHLRDGLETAVVRRSLLLQHPIRHELAALREALLQL